MKRGEMACALNMARSPLERVVPVVEPATERKAGVEEKSKEADSLTGREDWEGQRGNADERKKMAIISRR